MNLLRDASSLDDIYLRSTTPRSDIAYLLPPCVENLSLQGYWDAVLPVFLVGESVILHTSHQTLTSNLSCRRRKLVSGIPFHPAPLF